MNQPSEELFRWLAVLGLPGIIVVFLGLIAYLALNIEKLEALGAFISRVFAKYWKRSERKYIELDVRSKIDGLSKEIKKELGLTNQPGIMIEWVDVHKIDRAAFLNKGQIILRMSTYLRQEENVVHATLAYIRKTVLFHTRYYIHKAIDRGIDLTLGARVFSKDKHSPANEYFMDDIVRPEVQGNTLLHDCVYRMGELDARGYFGRIFLRELRNFGDKFPAMANPRDIEESRRFADFLFEAVSSHEGSPMDFRGTTVKTSIVRIARKGVAEQGEIGRYLKAGDIALRNGSRTIHFCAWGRGNVSFAKQVISAFAKDNRVYLKEKHEYKRGDIEGGSFPALWACFRSVV